MNDCDIGMVGLGIMGQNLLLNMEDHGFRVAGYDKKAATSLPEFLASLRKPRLIMLLVPAGNPVDEVINELLPHLQPDDLIIDGGNSHFTDTDRRFQDLKARDIHFLGVGISGGEKGARHGPSIMPGGSVEAYDRVRQVFEKVAAKVNADPCVAYLGPKSAGHYVKMVHNGIEYGIMQVIAETYDFMKRGLGLNNNHIRAVFTSWSEGVMSGYLTEITSHIFEKMEGDEYLIDKILAVAEQNGTGMWTSQSAFELQVPTPTIDLAVSMRDLSVLIKQREQANRLYYRPISLLTIEQDKVLKQLQDALFAAMMIVYAQGFALLASASQKYAYSLDLATVARVWRGGCIIRSQILEDILAAFSLKKDLSNLLLDANFSRKIMMSQENLRQVVSQASTIGLPIPALMVSLSYLDAYRCTWLPANLIQAQRDYFGAHTYQRIDSAGSFHTEWENENE